MSEPSPRPRSWRARATTTAGPVKALAGAAVAVIGLLAVVLPMLAGGSDGARSKALFLEGRLTQPMAKRDFERLGPVLEHRGPAPRSPEPAASASWPGAWISLRLVVRGVEGTRVTWAVLRADSNAVVFTSADARVSDAGPAPQPSETPVQADVWVPFPTRLGRYVVGVYLLPGRGPRLDDYVSPAFTVATLPARTRSRPVEVPQKDEDEFGAPARATGDPVPHIDVPDPVFTATG